MKALCLESPKHWKQIDIEAPRKPNAGEALVRVHRVGICGTDISGYLGKMPFFSYPRIPGHTNCCEQHQTLGVHCDGGLRPQFLVPARKLHISRKLTFDQLALVETLAIGCHAVNRGAPRPEESCLVIGAGPI